MYFVSCKDFVQNSSFKPRLRKWNVIEKILRSMVVGGEKDHLKLFFAPEVTIGTGKHYL
jgi:hypothetical protein